MRVERRGTVLVVTVSIWKCTNMIVPWGQGLVFSYLFYTYSSFYLCVRFVYWGWLCWPQFGGCTGALACHKCELFTLSGRICDHYYTLLTKVGKGKERRYYMLVQSTICLPSDLWSLYSRQVCRLLWPHNLNVVRTKSDEQVNHIFLCEPLSGQWLAGWDGGL